MKLVYSYVPSMSQHTYAYKELGFIESNGIDAPVKKRQILRAYARSRRNSPPRIFPQEPLGLLWRWECDECRKGVRYLRVLPSCSIKVNCRECGRVTEHVGVV